MLLSATAGNINVVKLLELCLLDVLNPDVAKNDIWHSEVRLEETLYDLCRVFGGIAYGPYAGLELCDESQQIHNQTDPTPVIAGLGSEG